jgi:plasmid maintenance system antidote protein VapI
VSGHRIGDIVAGERTINADTDRRLWRFSGLSDGRWLRGQANYDTVRARDALARELAKIEHCALFVA